VDNLVAQLTRLPGIGTRTAQRLAFHILAAPADEANAIGSAIAEVKARVRPCRECGNLTEEELCGVCADPRRDRTVICVVEQPIDVVSLERTHEYRGLYHVLGGALSPLDGVEPADLRIHRLMERVDVDGVEEVVLATNPTMTGEATAAYLADRLRDRVTVTRLPGIGTRTAQRLAFHILAAPADEANAIGSAIAEVKARVRPCRECGNLTEEDLCGVCADPRRDRTVICVVEQPIDVVSLERTHEYRGLYHVLGGALSPLDGVEPADLRIHRLMERVDVDGVEEVVLATNPTMTGEATAAYLADRLRDRVTVTRLASGLPVGGDLEYADEVTLGRALSGRRPA
jgi:recombination protein RecR